MDEEEKLRKQSIAEESSGYPVPVDEHHEQGRRHTQYVIFMGHYAQQDLCIFRHIVEGFHNQRRRHTQSAISEVSGPRKNELEGFPGERG